MKTTRNTTGLLLTLIPAFIALVVTYATWTDSEATLIADSYLQGPVFIAPVDLTQAKVTTGFGNRAHPTTGRTILHSGLDLATRQGEPVLAASSGTVVKALSDKERGNYVVIQHDDMYATSYSHMNSIAVKVGQTIESGTVVGVVGSTGISTGPHLHFEILKDGKAVDPSGYLHL